MFALKEKYEELWPTNSDSDRFSFFTTVDGSNALLYKPMVNFSAEFYCLPADKIAAFCRLSVRASVRDKSEHCVIRCEIGLRLLQGMDKKSPPDYSGTPTSAPTTTFSPNWSSQPLVKNYIANCGLTVPNTTVVCIDSLRGNISLHYSTVPSLTFTGTLPPPNMQSNCRVARGFLIPSCPQTFHIHVGLFTLVYLLTFSWCYTRMSLLTPAFFHLCCLVPRFQSPRPFEGARMSTIDLAVFTQYRRVTNRRTDGIVTSISFMHECEHVIKIRRTVELLRAMAKVSTSLHVTVVNGLRGRQQVSSSSSREAGRRRCI